MKVRHFTFNRNTALFQSFHPPKKKKESISLPSFKLPDFEGPT